MSAQLSALDFAARRTIALPLAEIRRVNARAQFRPAGTPGEIAEAFGLSRTCARIVDVLRLVAPRRLTIDQIMVAIGAPDVTARTVRCNMALLKRQLAACHLQGAIQHVSGSGRFGLAPGAAHLITGHLATITKGTT